MPRVTDSLRRTRYRWAIAGLAGAAILLAALIALLRLAPSQQARYPRSATGPPLTHPWVPSNLRSAVHVLVGESGHAGVVLAGTTGGVWRSADGGAVWHRDGRGLRRDVLALGAASSGLTVFAGTFGGVVYERTAGDAHWRPISPPLQTLTAGTSAGTQRGAGINFGSGEAPASIAPIFGIAVSPHARIVLVASLGAIYRGEARGGSWNWQRVLWKPGTPFTSIIWAPRSADLAFVSVSRSSPPILASHDGGRSWRAASAGLPPSLPTQTLAVGLQSTRHMYLSTDGGGMWTQVDSRPWHDTSRHLPQRSAIAVTTSTTNPTILYAGTEGRGAYVKVGAGAWQRLGRGLNANSAIVLTLAEAHDPFPVLLAGTESGVFRYRLNS